MPHFSQTLLLKTVRLSREQEKRWDFWVAWVVWPKSTTQSWVSSPSAGYKSTFWCGLIRLVASTGVSHLGSRRHRELVWPVYILPSQCNNDLDSLRHPWPTRQHPTCVCFCSDGCRIRRSKKEFTCRVVKWRVTYNNDGGAIYETQRPTKNGLVGATSDSGGFIRPLLEDCCGKLRWKVKEWVLNDNAGPIREQLFFLSLLFPLASPQSDLRMDDVFVVCLLTELFEDFGADDTFLYMFPRIH